MEHLLFLALSVEQLRAGQTQIVHPFQSKEYWAGAQTKFKTPPFALGSPGN
jgi:hypothetical protein